ncbi:hypothetical protein CHCC20335_4019 [Bacillus paralicheniformis]|nr:hypothetical protein CHCC20335_4019 [Bacillus paralicheniformis]
MCFLTFSSSMAERDRVDGVFVFRFDKPSGVEGWIKGKFFGQLTQLARIHL